MNKPTKQNNRDPFASFFSENINGSEEHAIHEAEQQEAIQPQHKKRRKKHQTVRTVFTMPVYRITFLDTLWRKISAARTVKSDTLYKSTIVGVILDILKENGSLSADYSNVKTEQDLKEKLREILKRR